MHQLIYHQEKTQNPLSRRLGGLQSCSGHSGEEKSLLLLLGFEPWIVWPIAQSLYKLCHPIPSHYK